MNPVALAAHTFVALAGLLLALVAVQWSPGIVLGCAGGFAVLAALAVGTVRKSTGRHHAVGGDTSLLWVLLHFDQQPGRHRQGPA